MSIITCEDFDEDVPRPSSPEPTIEVSGGIPGFYTYTVNGVSTVGCPFDRSHMMRRHRLQYHLVKCVKNHIGEKVKCPYNAAEYVYAENLINHLSICPSRDLELVSKWNSEVTKKRSDNPYSSSANVPPPMDVPYEIDEIW